MQIYIISFMQYICTFEYFRFIKILFLFNQSCVDWTKLNGHVQLNQNKALHWSYPCFSFILKVCFLRFIVKKTLPPAILSFMNRLMHINLIKYRAESRLHQWTTSISNLWRWHEMKGIHLFIYRVLFENEFEKCQLHLVQYYFESPTKEVWISKLFLTCSLHFYDVCSKLQGNPNIR